MANPLKPYECPQCGQDPNGSEVHTLTHHTFPPYSEQEAMAIVKRRIKAASQLCKVAIVKTGITTYEFRVGFAMPLGHHYLQQLGDIKDLYFLDGHLVVTGTMGTATFNGASHSIMLVDFYPVEEKEEGEGEV